jgi:hypothetical protein
VLVSANHTSIDPYRPLLCLDQVRITAQLVKDPHPRLVA